MKTAPVSPQPPSSGPWWHYKLVWMVWAGPVIVVVAAVASFGLAVGHPDELVTVQPIERSLTPAHTARNHAATGAAMSRRPDIAPPSSVSHPPR
jgi:hypothetical protein